MALVIQSLCARRFGSMSCEAQGADTDWLDRWVRLHVPGHGDTAAVDTMFSEYSTVSDYAYNAPNWREWYNMTTDKYQLTNSWGTIGPATQTAMLTMLEQIWKCKGSSCP